MNSEKILTIAFYLGLGAFAYHYVQKRRGVMQTHKEVEDWKDNARINLHNLLDDMFNGHASEKEIEQTVYEVIP